jgi:hypothetical protein
MILLKPDPNNAPGPGQTISDAEAKQYFDGYTNRRKRLIEHTDPLPFTDDAKITEHEPLRGWAYTKASIQKVLNDIPDTGTVYFYFGVGPKSKLNGALVTHVIISGIKPNDLPLTIKGADFGTQHGEAI